MIKLMEGGHYEEKGYYYLFFINVPIVWINEETQALKGGKYKTTLIEFPNRFCLTTNKNYVKLDMSMFGFGFGIEICTRSDNG